MPDPTEVIYKLSRAKRHEGHFLPGVPLRDLTRADLDSLPEHVRQSIEQGDLYYAPKQPDAGDAAPAAADAATATTTASISRRKAEPVAEATTEKKE